MKILKNLLFLLALAFGLSACDSDNPTTTPLTGTRWELNNLTRQGSTSSTNADIQLSFERSGRVVITAGYGTRTSVSTGTGSRTTRRQLEATLTTSYRYVNSSIRIFPATLEGDVKQSLEDTEVLAIIEQLYTDASLNESQTRLTFNPFEPNRRFTLQRVSR